MRSGRQPARAALSTTATCSSGNGRRAIIGASPCWRYWRFGFGGLALVAYRGGDPRWLIGAAVLDHQAGPISFFVVVPLNNRLLASASDSNAGAQPA